MVICDSISSPSAQQQAVTKERKFFDRWSEYEAHEFTFEILRTMGFADAVKDARASVTDTSHLAVFFNRLSVPDYRSESDIPFSLIQARALFQKNDDFRAGFDKEDAAFQSWIRSEQQCSDTNLRWSDNLLSSRAKTVAFFAQQYIARVLGPVPTLDELDLRFGPGATTSCEGFTSARWKLSAPLTASNALFRLQSELNATIPGWLSDKPWIPSVGALAFVPKNYKTYRSIDIPPLLNTLVQKGIGTYMKHRLLKAGVNLYDQSINQSRAHEGSLTGYWATLDLERASDTLSYLTVMNLLPWDWFCLLDAARSAHTSYRGKLYTLNKFSSMGCGFTFELESLIFAAICWGVEELTGADHEASVYGDDIITSQIVGKELKSMLPEFGFTVNEEKSFFDGPFRESCGADFAFGVDVRPFFLRGLRDGGRWTYAKCVAFHNFLQRKPWFDSHQHIRHLLLSVIPEKYRIWGPDGYGDGFLVSHAPLRTYLEAPRRLRKKGYEGFLVRAVVAQPVVNLSPCAGDEFLPSYLAGTQSGDSQYVVRASKLMRLRERFVNMYVV